MAQSVRTPERWPKRGRTSQSWPLNFWRAATSASKCQFVDASQTAAGRCHEDQRHAETDANLLREARVLAAEEGRSISALLTDRLEAIIRERKAFDKARRRAFARFREGLDLRWTPPKSRDELHER